MKQPEQKWQQVLKKKQATKFAKLQIHQLIFKFWRVEAFWFRSCPEMRQEKRWDRQTKKQYSDTARLQQMHTYNTCLHILSCSLAVNNTKCTFSKSWVVMCVVLNITKNTVPWTRYRGVLVLCDWPPLTHTTNKTTTGPVKLGAQESLTRPLISPLDTLVGLMPMICGSTQGYCLAQQHEGNEQKVRH